MKLTWQEIREIIKEAIRDLNYKQFDDPDGTEGVVGTMDAADYYGSLDDEDNILHFLDQLSLTAFRNDKKKLARALTLAGDAIEKGKYALADKLLVFIFKTGGRNRAVYHAIAYVREKLDED